MPPFYVFTHMHAILGTDCVCRRARLAFKNQLAVSYTTYRRKEDSMRLLRILLPFLPLVLASFQPARGQSVRADQEPVLRAIKCLNGSVGFEDATKKKPVVIHLNGPKIDDAVIAALSVFVHLRELRVDNAEVTDQGLAVLKSLPKLDSLSLRKAAITDVG